MISKFRMTDLQFNVEGVDYSVDVDGFTDTFENDVVLTVTGFDAFCSVGDLDWTEVKGSTEFLNDAVRTTLMQRREWNMVYL